MNISKELILKTYSKKRYKKSNIYNIFKDYFRKLSKLYYLY